MDPANWNQVTPGPSTSVEDDISEVPRKVQRLEPLDFSRTSVTNVPSFETSKEFKIFRIIRKDGIQIEQLIRIGKKESHSILEKIAKRFKLKVNEVMVKYSLLMESGGEKEMSLFCSGDDESDKESQELFYTLAPETELLTIECLPHRSNRKDRNIEKLYKKYNKIGTTNRRSYEILMSVPQQCKTFLDKRRVVQLSMGSKDCINLLCPSRFKCFVPGCMKVVPLKLFSNLGNVKTHLKTHFGDDKVANNQDAEIVHRRLVHIENSKLLSRDENSAKTNQQILEELDNSSNEGGLPLSLHHHIKCVHEGEKFQGAHFDVDTSIIRKIAMTEPEPLSGYVDTRTIDSY